MSRMGMNIATARRGRLKQRPLPPPADKVTRDGGFICPVCLTHGRGKCAKHRGEEAADG